MKPIRLTKHASSYIPIRGFSINEVEETICSAVWQPSELGKMECRKEFIYHQIWNGKPYRAKQVRPIFIEEATEIVVITVYTYYY